MANRLAGESSPYLLQHKDNPVDWYPWGEEALARALAEDRPILLSIGYSACHWCHVMERESFEDAETAALMNRLFVPIKVDREERPDLDSIYMEAVQRLTGQGGWPMTMFLTPDGRPFYGGTYYPPEDRHGMPGFKRVLLAVDEAYRERREDMEQNADGLISTFGAQIPVRSRPELKPDLLSRAVAALATEYDDREGGFGHAPKFPQPMTLEVLLRANRHGDERAVPMAERTLAKMARGGIYDQLGGGFHRYSTDGRWLVPHFEKMLYDNAQLARIYADAHRATGNPFYLRIATETLRYVQREMTSPEGGFYSSQDADSEGEEGKFFVWSADEVAALLGDDAPAFMRAYDVTASGNFEGHTILNLPRDLQVVAGELGLEEDALQEILIRGRAMLFRAREQRVKPGRDEKIITAWNGLMLRAFATAAATSEDASFMATARASATFLLANLRRDGRLLRTYKDGAAKLNGYLEDYAFLADGLLALYEAGGGSRWLQEARSLADTMIAHFADLEGGPFYSTSDDHERLITRPRDLYDNATPSGNSVAAEVLLRLAVHTGEEGYRAPLAFARLLCAADAALDTPRELAIIGHPDDPGTLALLRVASARFDPNLVLALASPEEAASSGAPLLEGRTTLSGKSAAYLCERYACRAPLSAANALAQALR